jgi:hypothetical protein
MSDTVDYNLGMQDFSSDASQQNQEEFKIERVLNRRAGATLVQIVRAPYDVNGNAITPGSAAAVGYVDVQPLVNQVDGWGIPVPHDTVYHLSYHRYQGGGNAFICDPAVNDIGKMVIADRDTSIVKSTGAQGNPGSGRRGSYADGTYLGNTQGAAPTQYFAWLAQGFAIVDAFGNSITGTAGGVIINGMTITQAGDLINAVGTTFNTHKHTNGNDGADTGIPIAGS